MSKIKKEQEEYTLPDGRKLTLRLPGVKEFREAQGIYNAEFKHAVDTGAFLRTALDDFAKKQGIWSDEKQAEYDAIRHQILENEKILEKGGIKLSQAKAIALEMVELRGNLRSLIAPRSELDNKTAEGLADNEKFNYLISACLVYKDTGKPYFDKDENHASGYAAFLNSQTDPAAIWGATQLSAAMYGLDNNFEAKLPEFRFLKEYGFIDDQLRLINKDGHLVDKDGRLVDEMGRFINEKNQFVDREGNLVDEDGNYVVEKKPFLDDDGKEVVLEKDAPEVKEVQLEPVAEKVSPKVDSVPPMLEVVSEDEK